MVKSLTNAVDPYLLKKDQLRKISDPNAKKNYSKCLRQVQKHLPPQGNKFQGHALPPPHQKTTFQKEANQASQIVLQTHHESAVRETVIHGEGDEGSC